MRKLYLENEKTIVNLKIVIKTLKKFESEFYRNDNNTRISDSDK